MRIVTWNCQGAILDKTSPVLDLSPDLLVLQEVREKEVARFEKASGASVLWKGDAGQKGMLVASFNGWKLNLLSDRLKARHFLSFTMTKGRKALNVLAVWAMSAKGTKENSYIGQVFNALQELGSSLTDFDFLIGDFNANKIWDGKRKTKNFSAVAAHLEQNGFGSGYHVYKNESFGKEREPTLYLYRHENRPYHIDYCFLSIKLRKKLKSVEVGKYKVWKDHSDHAPLILDF